MSKFLKIDGLDIPLKVVQTDVNGNLVATNEGGSFSSSTIATSNDLPAGATIHSSLIKGNGFGSLYGCSFSVRITVGGTALSTISNGIGITFPEITDLYWDFSSYDIVCSKETVSGGKSNDVIPALVTSPTGLIKVTFYPVGLVETGTDVTIRGTFYAQSVEQ